LENIENFNEFYLDFYHFVHIHPKYELDMYEDILDENNLRWETDSMKSADISKLGEQCVLALITGAFRADHFSNGVLHEFIKDGFVDNWLNRLKMLDDERKPEEEKPALKHVKICLHPFRRGVKNELFITDKQMVIKCDAPDSGKVTHQHEFGEESELGEFSLNAMRDCLDADGWDDVKVFQETDFITYLYELEVEYEDGNITTHHGAFDRAHIPEKAFKTFIEIIRVAVNTFNFGGIINLDGFMNALKPGEVKYCGVNFSKGSGIYHYRTTDLRIDVGDTVIVPVGEDNNEQEVIVKTVDFCRWDDTPYPLVKTKQILRRASDKDNRATSFRLSGKAPALYLPDEIINDD